MRIQYFATSGHRDKVQVDLLPAWYLVDDRFISVVDNQELNIYDLRAQRDPVFRLSNVSAHILSTTLLVVFDGDAWFSCWKRKDTNWQQISRFQIPLDQEPELQYLEGIYLSDSDRFLLIGMVGKTRQALLFEIQTGEIKSRIPLTLSLRAAFATLPDGKEVLFTSAKSYMGVQMIECASGQLLHKFLPRSGFEFCHVSYELRKDATRLLTFGCVWAAPYEVRLYDATPWTMSTQGETQEGNAPIGPDQEARNAEPGRHMRGHLHPSVPSVGEEALIPLAGAGGPSSPSLHQGGLVAGVTPESFPLSEVFRQEEVFWGADIVLGSTFLPTEDGNLSCLSLIHLKDLPEPGSEDESDMLEGLSSRDREIYDALHQLSDSEMALLFRSVDPVKGLVSRWSLQSIPATNERHVHILSNHRVVLINERIQLFDGISGELHDYGAFQQPAHYFSTRVTSDAQTLIVQYDKKYAHEGNH